MICIKVGTIIYENLCEEGVLVHICTYIEFRASVSDNFGGRIIRITKRLFYTLLYSAHQCHQELHQG